MACCLLIARAEYKGNSRLAHQEETEFLQGSSRSPSKKLIVSAVFGVVALTVIGSAFYFVGKQSSATPHARADGGIWNLGDRSKEAIYVSLSPTFTVNFSGQGQGRFLQVSVEALTRNPEVESLIRKHLPMIRNELVLLFSSKTYAALNTREGKEELQSQALASVRSVLQKEAGTQDVEAVFFTSLVMQ